MNECVENGAEPCHVISNTNGALARPRANVAPKYALALTTFDCQAP